ncbi:AraC family transcriptional regulator [Massilia sp. Dwa41.01b]|uniref:AraC family transcriptional regulator n=1 Tax=unclassified Massilia TaxID=2609279 RepID=UPI00160328BF|nr:MULTISPECIES: AraC family transcriptional regulator [unclassified Massilia]QNA87931.1 AraC family transcriptional regulator [Massilia sp. Dwa41.01b]QNA98834.1 AraC family transcriptional regulator [Massilia sp. Se16.2.3]
MSNRTTSAAWVKGICGLFEHEGLDVQDLFGEAGMCLADLDNPDMRCPTEKVSRLWNLAVQRSRNCMIALSRPPSSSLANFDVIGYAMMSCPNLLASLECLVRYLRVVSEAATLVLREEGDAVSIEMTLCGGGDSVPRQRYEFDTLTLLSFLRWISQRDILPRFVEFDYPPPAHPRRYEEAFQSPVRFDAAANRLVLSAADLRLPLPTHNPALEKFHAQFAGQRLIRLDNRRISRKVSDLIAGKLLGCEPRREDIARLLCLGDRTLRRRLEDEGTSFKKILDETRRELARQYFAQRRYSVGEIAYMLGFADQGTLFRACRRWFDVSPKQYQARYEA